MKKVLSLIVGAAFAVALFLTVSVNNAANVNADGDVKVVIHYQRLDNSYAGSGIYNWAGIKVEGANDGAQFSNDKTDAFGAYLEGTTTAALSANEIIVFRKGVTQTAWQGWAAPDGVESECKSLGGNLKWDKADADAAFATGEIHLYYFEGMKLADGNNLTVAGKDAADQADAQARACGTVEAKEGFGILKIVYYSKAEDYYTVSEDEEGNAKTSEAWEIWTWGTGTGGTAPDGDLGVQFTETFTNPYNGVYGTYRIAYMYVAADATDTLGFIVRSFGGWNAKKNAGGADIFIDATDIKGTGSKTVYYLAGEAAVRTDAEEFYNECTKFEFTQATFFSTENVQVVINKEIAVAEVAENKIAELIKVYNASNELVEIATYAYDQSATTLTTFSLTLKNAINATATDGYTVKFDGVVNGNALKAEKAVATPDIKFEIVNEGVVDVEIGSEASAVKLPEYTCADEFNDYTRLAYVSEGTVDTSKVGSYTVTLKVDKDALGRAATATVTFNVYDPCAEEEENTAMNIASAALVALVPLTLAGAIVIKKFNM